MPYADGTDTTSATREKEGGTRVASSAVDATQDASSLRAEDITVTDPKVVKRAVAAATVGNITEWYDFGVYGYFILTLQKVFFAGMSDTASLIAAFGVFASSFLVRPIGGLIFGSLGDRIGRTKVLAMTVILMAASTFCIGLVPSYDSIGIAAPILVLLAKLGQGLSTGGEYSGSMTFIAEYTPDKRRGFTGSWLEFGTFTGYSLDRKSTRLNSSHVATSYAVFCLKKKKRHNPFESGAAHRNSSRDVLGRASGVEDIEKKRDEDIHAGYSWRKSRSL